MRINNNMMAMNTHRQLGIATTGGAKTMEKLSSGFRINRAGDDAAGLAISEKMRGQIRGLTQASRNAQDGISLIQTAEGALNETHAILQRMRELAVQSSTDTNTDEDRINIQDEIDQLTSEITRIAETTEFNTMKLLDGSYADKKFHIGSNEGQNITFDVKDMTAKALGLESANKMIATVNDASYETQNSEIKSIDVTVTAGATNADGSATATLDKETGKLTLNVVTNGGAGAALTKDALNEILKEFGVEASAVPATAALTSQDFKAKTADIGGIKEAYVNVADKSVTKLDFVTNSAGAAISITKNNDGEVSVAAGQSATLKEINDALKDYGITIMSNDKTVTDETVIGAVTAGVNLDVNAGNIAIKVDTQENADKAITTINDALENVSKERSKLGAYQNRLEHTIKNLDTSAENLQASEARIRDVDMAKEMMEQTKQNILQQASTAMLAQASQNPQTVLQLLQ